jgi:predicted transcriptional regulator
MNKISDSEYEIMKIVWQHEGPISSIEILNLVPNIKGWKNTTTLTLISRLVDKGALKIFDKAGKAFRYLACISEDEFKLEETRSFLSKMHDGKLNNLVATLFESNDLTDKEIKELKNLFGGDK